MTMMSSKTSTVLAFGVLVSIAVRSAWTAPSEKCLRDIRSYFEGLAPSEPKSWAVEMFDASSKFPPDGISELTFTFQLGNYDECLAVQAPAENDHFRGKYCRFNVFMVPDDKKEEQGPLGHLILSTKDVQPAHITLEARQTKSPILPENTSVVMGQWTVCAPSSCNSEGVEIVADINLKYLTFISNFQFSSLVAEESCYYEGDKSRTIQAGGWIFIGILAAIFCIELVLTAFDHFSTKDLHPAFTSFSLKHNLTDLFKIQKAPPAGQLNCLHGIRVISTLWVILLHTYSNLLTVNARTASQNLGNWSMAPVLSGGLSVETFFVLSGLLTTYIPLVDQMKGRNFNVFKYIVYRYLRLTIPLAVLIWYFATVHYSTSDGPLWDFSLKAKTDKCAQYWWTNLLYIANYYESGSTLCVGQTWYLMVDMQMALLAPFVIIPLLKWPKYGIGLIWLLILASMGLTFALTYIYSLSWTIVFYVQRESTGDFNDLIYNNTLARAVSFLFGMFLGFILSKKIEVKIPKWGVVLGWLLNTVLCLTVVYVITIPYNESYDKLGAAFYATFHRLAWSVGIGWVIWACVNNYGGPINSILSWKYFLPLSKLSYCAFLIHLDIIVFHTAIQRTYRYFSNFETVYDYFSVAILTFPLAILLHVVVEAPSMALIRILFGKSRQSASRITSKQQ
ncbi:nose resistant to fluoxetine protein 6-like [Neocloeon triangulifer]|uniref:nose resistant to fluoxetine protein 6-like n=1 Tax=Neocloeon triangulifer TaxID=2078957 RepID=UPI00286F42F1|nr:nose resistant to fluoxetine protein 6-like [Neocloeon triangulifer]